MRILISSKEVNIPQSQPKFHAVGGGGESVGNTERREDQDEQ